MGANIPTGTLVNYKGQWHAGGLTGPQDVINKVSSALAADGITVRNSDWSGSALGDISGYIGAGQDFTATLQVQVTGGLGYNSADDVRSIIDHEVYTATSTLPASSSIPNFTLPGTTSVSGFTDWLKSLFTGSTSTGQGGTDTSGGFSLSNITSSGTLYIAIAIFGFIGALALIGYSGALKRGV
jgi:hypothetical protein